MVFLIIIIVQEVICILCPRRTGDLWTPFASTTPTQKQTHLDNIDRHVHKAHSHSDAQTYDQTNMQSVRRAHTRSGRTRTNQLVVSPGQLLHKQNIRHQSYRVKVDDLSLPVGSTDLTVGMSIVRVNRLVSPFARSHAAAEHDGKHETEELEGVEITMIQRLSPHE